MPPIFSPTFSSAVNARSQQLARVGLYFPDPFLDYASVIMPRNINDVLRWAEFIFLTNGTYRMAAQRVVRYFLTKIEIFEVADEEKTRYEKYLADDLGLMEFLAQVGDDWQCFHGDVRAVTRDGVFRLRDLAGKTVDVLSQGGVYRRAEFKSFGRQELLEIEFSDGRTVMATPEHQWVAKNCSGKSVRVSTTDIKKGYRIPRVVAPRPPKNDDFFEGIRHGFTFGDGTAYNGGKQTTAMFFGAKDAEMVTYFDGHGGEPIPRKDIEVTRIHGLPAHYKKLPANDSSASYWYGFVCGCLAADGSVDTYGCVLLTQASKATLDAIAIQLPRIGMAAGPVRGYRRTASILQSSGEVNVYDSDMYYVTLLKRFMTEDDLLLSSHRGKFIEHKTQTDYGEYVRVCDVRRTGIVDDVFCCVEPDTHTFVIDNGMLTGNCYGNAFISVFIPFIRLLRCPKCQNERPVKEVIYQFRSFEFYTTCDICNYKGRFSHVDRREADPAKIRLIRWSPHEIKIMRHPVSGDSEYFWQIPERFRNPIRRGLRFYIETMPWEIVEAVRDHKLMRFKPNKLFHLREETVAGLNASGWGVSRILSNFKQAYYIQIVKRYNEALALDYIIPFRVLTPSPGSSRVADPVLHTNLGQFGGRVMNMIQAHRRDPATWHWLPFPIDYKAMGGEARSLTAPDLLDQAHDEMLNAIGIPAEMYRGTLTVQAAPTALRLFQQTWMHLTAGFNRLMNWILDVLSVNFHWEKARARLQPVTMADDLDRRNILLQLMAGNMVSKELALRAFGADPRDEMERILNERRMEMDLQQKFQEEMAQKQEMDAIIRQPAQMVATMPAMQSAQAVMAGAAGAMAPPGAAPPGAAPGAAPGMAPPGAMPPGGMAPAAGGQVTPEQKMIEAEQIAQQLLVMPELPRKQMLTSIRRSDETLHALVIAQLDKLRRQASGMGRQMVIQQMAGGM